MLNRPEYHITEPVKEYLVRLMEQPVCVCGEEMTDSHKEKIQAFIRDHLITDVTFSLKRAAVPCLFLRAIPTTRISDTCCLLFSERGDLEKDKERSAKGKNLSICEKILVLLMKKQVNALSRTSPTQRPRSRRQKPAAHGRRFY